MLIIKLVPGYPVPLTPPPRHPAHGAPEDAEAVVVEPHPVDAEELVEVVRVRSMVEPERASSLQISAQAMDRARHAPRKMAYAPAIPNPGTADFLMSARGARLQGTELFTAADCSRGRGHRKESSLRRALPAPLIRSHSKQSEPSRG